MQREVAKAEADVQLVRDRAARDQARLDAGTGTAKDLEASSTSSTSLARRQSELEDVELEVMERAEAAESDVAELERGRGELDRRASRRSRPRATRRSPSSRPRPPTVGAPRADVVAGVGADLVALYEKIRAASGGIGRRRAAPAPLRRLPARAQPRSTSSRIRAAPDDEVLRCEECRRILVRTAESGPVSRGRALIVEADGGSRGNPGPAGYGALVRDADTGEVLAERAEPLGMASQQRRRVLAA